MYTQQEQDLYRFVCGLMRTALNNPFHFGVIEAWETLEDAIRVWPIPKSVECHLLAYYDELVNNI